jgi:hypothetical protein
MKAFNPKNHLLLEAAYAGAVAFSIYTCMYAFRKPFTSASYEGIILGGIGLKSWLIIAQLIGYTISKFYGIRFISSLPKMEKWRYILLLIFLSWVPLFLFPLLPPWAGIILFFFNGLPLGMIWGIVFSYLEGRRSTELAGALLCASFIFSSGMVKSIGKWLMNTYGMSEFWMPFAVGGIFLVPLLFFLNFIERMQPPSLDDVNLRSERTPMNNLDRKIIWKTFGPGLVFLIIAYIGLTIIRDLRDNFAAEIWAENGLGKNSAIFSQSELPATLIVLALMGTLVFIKNNKTAFRTIQFFIVLGLSVAIATSILFHFGLISVELWMISLGIGLYMSYIPFNCILFERFFAVFRCKGNSGFLIYLSDAFGYLGSVSILIWKEIGSGLGNWTTFLTDSSLIVGAIGLISMLLAANYFNSKQKSYFNV